jgi:hypothetical protein
MRVLGRGAGRGTAIMRSGSKWALTLQGLTAPMGSNVCRHRPAARLQVREVQPDSCGLCVFVGCSNPACVCCTVQYK